MNWCRLKESGAYTQLDEAIVFVIEAEKETNSRAKLPEENPVSALF